MVRRCCHEASPTVTEVDLFAAAGRLAPEHLNRCLLVLHLAKGGWPIQVEVFGYHHQSYCPALVVEEEEPEKTLCGIERSTER